MWKNNQANGFGRMIYSDGDYYEGDWLEDLSMIYIINYRIRKGHLSSL